MSLPAPLAKQSVNQFISHADSGEILVGIRAAMLIWIQDRVGGRRAFRLIRQMVIRDDHIQSVLVGPVKRLVCANAAIDADHQLVALCGSSFQGRLLNAIPFSEAMRHMIAKAVPPSIFRPTHQHGGAGRAIDIVVTVDQDRLGLVDRAQQPRDSFGHTEHQRRIVKLIV